MGPEGIKQTIQLGNETITIETGRLAKQADGAAVVTCGKTVLGCHQEVEVCYGYSVTRRFGDEKSPSLR